VLVLFLCPHSWSSFLFLLCVSSAFPPLERDGHPKRTTKRQYNTTRLLRIQIDDDGIAALRTRFKIAPLTSKPQYTALPYTWGSSKPQHNFLVGDAVIKIGSNLHDAITAIQKRRDTPLVLNRRHLCDGTAPRQYGTGSKAL